MFFIVVGVIFVLVGITMLIYPKIGVKKADNNNVMPISVNYKVAGAITLAFSVLYFLLAFIG